MSAVERVRAMIALTPNVSMAQNVIAYESFDSLLVGDLVELLNLAESRTPRDAAAVVLPDERRESDAPPIITGGTVSPEEIWTEAWNACLAEVARLNADGGWRTMDSAPKDRTPILISCPSSHEGNSPIVGEAYRADDGEFWWAGTGPGDYHADPIIENCPPTHWRPLPPPPNATTGVTT